MDKNRKMKGDYSGPKRTAWLLWKDTLNRQIFIVGGLHFVEREQLNVALYLFNCV